MSKFNVGDIVIGNRKARIYGITNQGWTGRVIDTRIGRLSGVPEIEVVYQETDVFAYDDLAEDEYYEYTTSTSWVNEDRFDLYEPCINDGSLEELDKFLSGFGGK